MLILIGLAVLLLIGIILMKTMYDDFTGIMITVLAGACLLITLIVWPFIYYDIKVEIVQYKELQSTIERARENNTSEIERAALIDKLADANMEIRGYQYRNSGIQDIFIPDEIMKLEPLK